MSIRAEASIDINAPIDDVWRVMTDLSAYGAWNPFIIEVMNPPRELGVGGMIALRVKFANGKEEHTRERILQIDGPTVDDDGVKRATFAYKFVSLLDTFGLVRATRVQSLSQKDGGPTRYDTHETFTGFAAKYVPLSSVQAGFEAHANALKAKCESR
jgi:hypothetical protein